jgi:hypothetical protein
VCPEHHVMTVPLGDDRTQQEWELELWAPDLLPQRVLTFLGSSNTTLHCPPRPTPQSVKDPCRLQQLSCQLPILLPGSPKPSGFFFFFFFAILGFELRDSLLFKQSCYHLSHSISHFFVLDIFEIGLPKQFALLSP